MSPRLIILVTFMVLLTANCSPSKKIYKERNKELELLGKFFVALPELEQKIGRIPGDTTQQTTGTYVVSFTKNGLHGAYAGKDLCNPEHYFLTVPRSTMEMVWQAHKAGKVSVGDNVYFHYPNGYSELYGDFDYLGLVDFLMGIKGL